MSGVAGRSGNPGRPRPKGAGRKPGAVTLKDRRRANELCLIYGDTLPLDVMINNMLFWHQQAMSLGEKIEQLALRIEDPDARIDAMKLLRALLAARTESEKCAVDAAPYMHHRFATITVKGDKDNPIPVEVTEKMTPREAAEKYAGSIHSE